MYPRIYLSTEENFEHNGLGVLRDIVECYVEEEHNSFFELVMKYRIGGVLFDYLDEGNIIKADASDRLKGQLFRIHKTIKKSDSLIEVRANHISYDLMKDVVKGLDIKSQSCEYCLNEIFRQSDFCTHFTGYSDIEHSGNFSVEFTDCMSAIVGISGSIVDTFGNGAEILRDNFDIHVLSRRGKDDNVLIAYKKNMLGIEIEEDKSDLVTRIYPYAKLTVDNVETVYKPSFEFVDSDNIKLYEHPYSAFMDFSDKFEEGSVPTDEDFRNICTKYFKNNKCDLPKTNYKIQFIPLANTENYKDSYKVLEKVGMMDSVLVKDTRFNVDTEAKVVRTKYDVIREIYEEIELGSVSNRLNNFIQGSQGKPGADGADGADGAMGPMGPQGIPGLQGPPGKDGVSAIQYYTWIRYGESEHGLNMTNLPNENTTHIGIAYNQTDPIESEDASLYKWTRIKGNQGIPGAVGAQGTPGKDGADGKDGKSTYIYIQYALDDKGTGMQQSPEGMTHIGIGKGEYPIEPSEPSMYAWTKFVGSDGKDGIGIKGEDGKSQYIYIQYALDDKGTGMQQSPEGMSYMGVGKGEDPTEPDDPSKYAWSKIKGEDGIGIKGDQGDTTYMWVKYSKYPGGRDDDGNVSMSEYPEDMKYMGLAFNKLTDVESKVPEDYAWSLIRGQDGTIFYTHIKFADDKYGLNMSDEPEGKDYIGIAHNMLEKEESNNPNDYKWSKYVGNEGIPGRPGSDGKSLYTWIKFADDDKGTNMSDLPDGKAYMGLAYNQTKQEEEEDASKYVWVRIKGDKGDKGDNGADGSDGEDGKDGDIESFPDTLPSTPVLKTQSFFSSISLGWTYENKMYYTYEVYASQTKNFAPSSANLLYKGQASAFLHNVSPSQTWYYRVRCVNSHGRATAYSAEVSGSTFKLNSDNIGNYMEEATIKDALIGELRLDRGWVGKLVGTHIDARNLTVTDGNGKRTLEIDSFGNVRLNVTELTINSEKVETEKSVTNKINEAKQEMTNTIDKEVNDMSIAINNTINDLEQALSDSILTESERASIKEHIEVLKREKADIVAQVEALAKATELKNTTELTTLNKAYTEYLASFDGFLARLSQVVSRKKGE